MARQASKKTTPAFTLTVPADWEGWKAGEVLSDKGTIQAFARSTYNATKADTEKLSDDVTGDQIMAVVKSTVRPDGADDMAYLEAIHSAIEEANFATTEVETGTIRRGQSELLDAAMSAGEAFPAGMVALLESHQDKAEDVAGTPLHLAYDYIDKTPALAALFDAAPRPKTRWDSTPDEATYPGDNQPADYFQFRDPNAEKPRTISWYAAAYDSSPAGQHVNAVRDLLSRAKKKEMVLRTATEEGDEGRWGRLPNESPWQDIFDAHKYKAIKARWDARRTNGIAALRRAQLFRLNRAAIADMFGSEGFSAQPIDTNINVTARKKKAIQIQRIPLTADGKVDTTQKLGMSDAMTVDTFNRINVWRVKELAEKANQRVGLSHFVEALKKPPVPPSEGAADAASGKGIPANPTTEQVHAMVNSLATFWDNTPGSKLAALKKLYLASDMVPDLLAMDEMVENFQKFLEPFRPSINEAKAKQRSA